MRVPVRAQASIALARAQLLSALEHLDKAGNIAATGDLWLARAHLGDHNAAVASAEGFGMSAAFDLLRATNEAQSLAVVS
jgi:hypothetical protein